MQAWVGRESFPFCFVIFTVFFFFFLTLCPLHPLKKKKKKRGTIHSLGSDFMMDAVNSGSRKACLVLIHTLWEAEQEAPLKTPRFPSWSVSSCLKARAQGKVPAKFLAK